MINMFHSFSSHIHNSNWCSGRHHWTFLFPFHSPVICHHSSFSRLVVLGDFVKKSRREKSTWTKNGKMVFQIAHILFTLQPFNHSMLLLSQLQLFPLPRRQKVSFSTKEINRYISNTEPIQCSFSVCAHFWVGSSTANIIIILQTCARTDRQWWRHFFSTHYVVASPQFNLISGAH